MEEIDRRPARRWRGRAAGLVAGLVVVAAITGGYLGLHRSAAGDSIAGHPPARAFAAMAYDPDGGVVVMFGGAGSGPGLLDDTWLWAGGSWTEATPAQSPPARFGAEMAWDPKSQRVVLIGGMGGSGCGWVEGGAQASSPQAPACIPLQDAWAWDGADWTRLDLGQGADQLGGHDLAGAQLASDPAAGDLVLVTSAAPPPTTVPPSPWGPGQPTSIAGSAAADAGAGCAVCPVPSSTGGGGMAGGAVACPMIPASPGCPVCPPAAYGSTSPATGSAACAPSCPATASCVPVAASDTWVFDGTTFQRVSTGASAPPLGGELAWFPGPGVLADVSAGPQVAMGVAGGSEIACPQRAPCPYGLPGPVWEWNGSHWTVAAIATGVGPGGFAASPVTDLSAGDVVVLNDAGRTWVGTDPASGWSLASPVHPISARDGPAMAYDQATRQVVLFGGEVYSSTTPGASLEDDTWTWDGEDWTEQGLPTTSSAVHVPTSSAIPLPYPMGTPTGVATSSVMPVAS